MLWGDTVGLDKIAAKMAEYEGQMGEAYKPAKLLEEKAGGERQVHRLITAQSSPVAKTTGEGDPEGVEGAAATQNPSVRPLALYFDRVRPYTPQTSKTATTPPIARGSEPGACAAPTEADASVAHARRFGAIR